MKRIRKVVVHITDKAEPKPNIYQYFQRIVVDGVEYWDSLNLYTHEEALALAKGFNLRVLERWELCKLYDESEDFRSSLACEWYWSAALYSSVCGSAWLFNGGNGSLAVDTRCLSIRMRLANLTP